MFRTKHIAGSGFRVFDGGGGDDDAMSGMIGADRDRARAQSNDSDRAQSNDRRKSGEIAPESETGFETGVGLRTGLETGVGLGLDVFGRLANTSTTHIHRSPPAKQRNKLDRIAQTNHRQCHSRIQRHPDHGRNGQEDSGDDDGFGDNEFKGAEGNRDGVTGGADTSHGVSYLASEDDACMQWMHQHTLLTATERHVAMAASTKVPSFHTSHHFTQLFHTHIIIIVILLVGYT